MKKLSLWDASNPALKPIANQMNEIVGRVNSLYPLVGRGGIRVQEVAGGGVAIYLESEGESRVRWFGAIVANGPAGEPDFTDERYWVKLVYALQTNDTTDRDAVNLQLETAETAVIVCVSNTRESETHTHLLPTDGTRRVWVDPMEGRTTGDLPQIIQLIMSEDFPAAFRGVVVCDSDPPGGHLPGNNWYWVQMYPNNKIVAVENLGEDSGTHTVHPNTRVAFWVNPSYSGKFITTYMDPYANPYTDCGASSDSSDSGESSEGDSSGGTDCAIYQTFQTYWNCAESAYSGVTPYADAACICPPDQPAEEGLNVWTYAGVGPEGTCVYQYTTKGDGCDPAGPAPDPLPTPDGPHEAPSDCDCTSSDTSSGESSCTGTAVQRWQFQQVYDCALGYWQEVEFIAYACDEPPGRPDEWVRIDSEDFCTFTYFVVGDCCAPGGTDLPDAPYIPAGNTGIPDNCCPASSIGSSVGGSSGGSSAGDSSGGASSPGSSGVSSGASSPAASGTDSSGGEASSGTPSGSESPGGSDGSIDSSAAPSVESSGTGGSAEPSSGGGESGGGSDTASSGADSAGGESSPAPSGGGESSDVTSGGGDSSAGPSGGASGTDSSGGGGGGDSSDSSEDSSGVTSSPGSSAGSSSAAPGTVCWLLYERIYNCVGGWADPTFTGSKGCYGSGSPAPHGGASWKVSTGTDLEGNTFCVYNKWVYQGAACVSGETCPDPTGDAPTDGWSHADCDCTVSSSANSSAVSSNSSGDSSAADSSTAASSAAGSSAGGSSAATSSAAGSSAAGGSSAAASSGGASGDTGLRLYKKFTSLWDCDANAWTPPYSAGPECMSDGGAITEFGAVTYNEWVIDGCTATYVAQGGACDGDPITTPEVPAGGKPDSCTCTTTGCPYAACQPCSTLVITDWLTKGITIPPEVLAESTAPDPTGFNAYWHTKPWTGGLTCSNSPSPIPCNWHCDADFIQVTSGTYIGNTVGIEASLTWTGTHWALYIRWHYGGGAHIVYGFQGIKLGSSPVGTYIDGTRGLSYNVDIGAACECTSPCSTYYNAEGGCDTQVNYTVSGTYNDPAGYGTMSGLAFHTQCCDGGYSDYDWDNPAFHWDDPDYDWSDAYLYIIWRSAPYDASGGDVSPFIDGDGMSIMMSGYYYAIAFYHKTGCGPLGTYDLIFDYTGTGQPSSLTIS